MSLADEIIARKLFRGQPVREGVARNIAKRFYEVDRNLQDQLFRELEQGGLIEIEKKGNKSIIKPRLFR